MGTTPSDLSEDTTRKNFGGDQTDYDKSGMMEESSSVSTTTSVHNHTATKAPTKRKLNFNDPSKPLKSPEETLMDSHDETVIIHRKRQRQETTRIPPSPNNSDDATISMIPNKKDRDVNNDVSESPSEAAVSQKIVEALRRQVNELNEDKQYLKRKLIESRREVETLKQDASSERDDDRSLQEFDPWTESSEQKENDAARTVQAAKEQESHSSNDHELEKYRNKLKDRDDKIQQLETKLNTLEQEKEGLMAQLTEARSDNNVTGITMDQSERKGKHRAYSKLHKLRKELTERINTLESYWSTAKVLVASLQQERANLQTRVRDLEQASRTMMAEVEQRLRVAVTRHQQALSRVQKSVEAVQRDKLVQAQEIERLVGENKRWKQTISSVMEKSIQETLDCRKTK